jgi:hypothetical protein
MLHSLSGQFKVGLWWFVGAYSNHSIHKIKEVGLKAQKGSVLDIKRGWYMGCKVMDLNLN